ncbi:MAG: BMP family ABC transporter substrate-binding protein [Clostridiales bacterium]|nr:BMP family ABC transporter substrate-binding protein [Clostridiales bacterium]
MNKRMSKKIILLLAVIFILSMTVGCSKEVKTELSPAEHVTESITNTFNKGSFDLSADMNFNLNYDELSKEFGAEEISKELFELINNASLSVDYKLKTDKKARSFDYFIDYDINYKSMPLLSMEMILNNDEFGFGLTNFYDKYFVVDFEAIMTQITKEEGLENLAKVDFEPYMAILMNTESEAYKTVYESTRYTDIVTSHLESRLNEGISEEITYKIGEEEFSEKALTYVYDFDFESYFNLLADIVKEAKTDDELKAYAKELLNELLDKFIETKDYVLFEMTEEEVLMTKEMLENEFDVYYDELISVYEEAFTEIQNEMDYLGEDGEMVMDIYDNLEISISINKDGLIRKCNMSLDYNGVGFNAEYIVNAIGDEVVIESKAAQYVDVLKFINFENTSEINNVEEFATIIKEFLLSAIDELSEGEAYTTLYEDLKPFEEELGLEISTIKMSLGMGKAYIENLETDAIVTMIEENLYNQYDDYDYDYDYDYDDTTELAPLDSVAFIAYKPIEISEVNAAVWESIETYAQSFTVESEYILSSDATAYTDFEQVIMSGTDIIFVQGSEFDSVVSELAEIYTMVQFVCLDSYPDYYGENVILIDYYNEETAYVAGAIAAHTTESNKIAFVGGVEDIETKNYEIAFKDGVASVDSELVVYSQYAESIANYDLGKEIADSISEQGIDVVYHAADQVGHAIIDASVNYNYKVIGNNTSYGNDLPTYLTATMRDYAYIIGNIMDDYNTGYISAYYAYGASDALYIPLGNLSADVITLKDALIEQISTGELYIPTYYGED